MCEIEDVRMELRDGCMRDLTVFVVPTICVSEALMCQPITHCRDSYKHLVGRPLARMGQTLWKLML